MRYSRFRSAMLGIEPQKRNRNTANSKNKVTKSKKDTKHVPKREVDDEERDDPVKPEPGFHSQPTFSEYQARHSNMRLKHETSQQQHHQYHQQQHHQTHHHPFQNANPFTPPSPLRLLTPCSDDMISAPHSMHFTPPPTLVAGFDHMSPEPPCGHTHDDQDFFQPFDYNLNAYGIPEMPIPDMPLFQQRPHSAGGDNLLPGAAHVEVKSEQWDGERR